MLAAETAVIAQLKCLSGRLSGARTDVVLICNIMTRSSSLLLFERSLTAGMLSMVFIRSQYLHSAAEIPIDPNNSFVLQIFALINLEME